MTTPAVPAAGIHLPWARVPVAVQEWAMGVAGARGAPTIVRDRSGGFSPGATSVLEWPGRTIFVKAVGAELNPDSPDLHRREALVSTALPRSPRVPRYLGSYDDGAWVALAFDAIEGRPPRHPWDAVEFGVVMEALSAMHDELTPSPTTAPGSLAAYAANLFGGWMQLASGDQPAGLDEWAVRHLDRLVELESGWPEACAGSTLVHGDIRSDNVLVAGDRVVFVDWPHAAVGNPAFDAVAWAPSVVLEGGPAPEDLLARHEPSRRADPDEVTALLVAISGFFVAGSRRPSPAGLPTLRAFQAAQGAVTLEWLRRRTGW